MNPKLYNSIDYFFNVTQTNENAYSRLRKDTSSIIADSYPLIDGLESQHMCSWLVDEAFVKQYVNVSAHLD